MARADGSPQEILIALLGYHGPGNRDVQPSLPRGTASVVGNKTSTWEYWNFTAWETEKCTGILWEAGIQTKQTSFSLREPTTHTQMSDSHPSPQDTPTPQLPWK